MSTYADTTIRTAGDPDPQYAAFDIAAYDIPGTPKLNGRKADRVTLTLEPIELDRTNPDHMNLAGRLEQGETVHITAALQLTRRNDTRNHTADDTDLTVTLRAAITDHAPQ